jgi:hypothetical protein
MARIPNRIERNRLAYLYVELSREMARTIGVMDMFGTYADMLLVACGVVIGHTEGRPFTASKLAQFVGIPRTTALRKLETLVSLGVIEQKANKYCLSPQRLEFSDEAVQRLKQIVVKFSP